MIKKKRKASPAAASIEPDRAADVSVENEIDVTEAEILVTDASGVDVIEAAEESLGGVVLDPADFDEASYLAANPDVLDAIAGGGFTSGWHHFLVYGRAEGRPLFPPKPKPRPRATPVVEVRPEEPVVVVPAAPAQAMPPCFLENLSLSGNGGVFIVGWVDDSASPLRRVEIRFADGDLLTIDGPSLARVRRGDVEAALAVGRHHLYGYWGFVASEKKLRAQNCQVTFYLDNGATQTFDQPARLIEDEDIRNVSLSHLAHAEYFGNQQVEGMLSIENSLGREVIKFNRMMSKSYCANPYVERFSTSTHKLKGSIIVCLYGKSEFLFLQNALFSGLPGIEDYEFIYVSNSPELSERLLREATISKRIYGLDQTVVLLPGNAGFGAANNVAARYAQSNRVMIVNPDVFPRDRDWAKKHTDLIKSRPKEQTSLFGLPLYYDDGSLMHGGMYFETETMPSLNENRLTRRTMMRVEHYGKGAPFSYAKFLESRPVPAVTGAFISADRHWYESLGGFTEDFIFGHYEDADICLKSLARGRPAWMHDIKMWHLEGKGSTRKPVHEGGSIVNRWLFAKNWEELVRSRLNGPNVELDSLVTPVVEPAAKSQSAKAAAPAPAAEPETKNKTRGKRGVIVEPNG